MFDGLATSHIWVAVDIAPGSAPNEVVVDLTLAQGVAYVHFVIDKSKFVASLVY
jgi:hypothetical protein